jgi:hypothetical protein
MTARGITLPLTERNLALAGEVNTFEECNQQFQLIRDLFLALQAQISPTTPVTPTAVNIVTNVQYTGHALVITTTPAIILATGNPSNTTVLTAALITPAKDVTWSAPNLAYDQYAGVYVLEAGSSSSQPVNTADTATCS